MADPQEKPQQAGTSDAQPSTHPKVAPPESTVRTDSFKALESAEKLLDKFADQLEKDTKELEAIAKDRVVYEQFVAEAAGKLAEIQDKSSEAYQQNLDIIQEYQAEYAKLKEKENAIGSRAAKTTERMDVIVRALNRNLSGLGSTVDEYKNITTDAIVKNRSVIKGLTEAMKKAKGIEDAKSGLGIGGVKSKEELASIKKVLDGILSTGITAQMSQEDAKNMMTKNFKDLLSTTEGRAKLESAFRDNLISQQEEATKELQKIREEGQRGFGGEKQRKDAEKRAKELKEQISRIGGSLEKLEKFSKDDLTSQANLESLFGESVKMTKDERAKAERQRAEDKVEGKKQPEWVTKTLDAYGYMKDVLGDIRGELTKGKSGYFKLLLMATAAYLGGTLGLIWARIKSIIYLGEVLIENGRKIARILSGPLSNFMTWSKGIYNTVKNFLNEFTIIKIISERIKTAIQAIKNIGTVIAGPIRSVTNAVRGIGTGIVASIGSRFNQIRNIIGPISNTIKNLATVIGTRINQVRNLIQRISTFLTPIKNIISGIFTIGNRIGQVGSRVGSIGTGIATLFGRFAPFLRIFVGAFKIFSGPVGIIIQALMSIWDIFKGFKILREQGASIPAAIAKALGGALIRFLTLGFVDLKTALKWVDKVKDFFLGLKDKIFGFFKGIFSPNPGILVKLIKSLFVSLPSMLFKLIGWLFKSLYVDLPMMIFKGIWSMVKSVFEKITGGLSKLPIIGRFFEGGGGGEDKQASGGGILSRVGDAAKGVFEKFKSVFNIIKPFLKKMLDFIIAPVKAFSDGVVKIIKGYVSIVTGIFAFVKKIMGYIFGVIEKVYSMITSIIKSYFDMVTNFIKGIFNAFQTVFDKLLSAFNRVASFLSDVVELVMSKVKLILSKLWDALAGTAIGKFLGLKKGEMAGVGGGKKSGDASGIYAKTKAIYDSGEVANMSMSDLSKLVSNLGSAMGDTDDENMKQNIKSLRGSIMSIAKERMFKIGKSAVKNMITGPANALAKAKDAVIGGDTSKPQVISNTTMMNKSTSTTQVTPAPSRYNPEPTIRGTQLNALPSPV